MFPGICLCVSKSEQFLNTGYFVFMSLKILVFLFYDSLELLGGGRGQLDNTHSVYHVSLKCSECFLNLNSIRAWTMNVFVLVTFPL